LIFNILFIILLGKKQGMDKMGRPKKYIVRLTLDERRFLLQLIHSEKVSKEKRKRAHILLKTDCGEEGENWNDKDIAQAFYITELTVQRTRQALVEEGFENALNRKKQENRKNRIIQGEEEAYLIALVCSEPPEGHSQWSLRLLSDKMIELEYVETVSHETIRSVLKKMKLNLGKRENGAFQQKKVPSSSVKWKRC
jgi:transposase